MHRPKYVLHCIWGPKWEAAIGDPSGGLAQQGRGPQPYIPQAYLSGQRGDLHERRQRDSRSDWCDGTKGFEGTALRTIRRLWEPCLRHSPCVPSLAEVVTMMFSCISPGQCSQTTTMLCLRMIHWQHLLLYTEHTIPILLP